MIKNLYSSITLVLFTLSIHGQSSPIDLPKEIDQNQQLISYEIECQDELVFLDFLGSAYVFPELLLVEETAYDSLLDWSVDQSNFSCEDIGPNTVIVSAMNLDSLSLSCTAILEVIDAFPPIVECKDTIQISLNQEDEIIVLDSLLLIKDLQDNCSTSILDISPAQLSIEDIGETTVDVTVQDGAENIASCKTIIQLDVVLSNLHLIRPEEPTVTPNPSGGFFRIDMSKGISKQAKLTIFTSEGKEIHQYSKSYENEGYDIGISLPGVYFIRIIEKKEQYFLRVLVE